MNSLVFNETGIMYLYFLNNSRVLVFPVPAGTVSGDNNLRATLDPDGVFRFVL